LFRVEGRRLEAEFFVERRGFFIDCMNQDCSRADRVGCGQGTLQGIHQQGLAQTRALFVVVDRQSRE
jgi:hypothetical protein